MSERFHCGIDPSLASDTETEARNVAEREPIERGMPKGANLRRDLFSDGFDDVAGDLADDAATIGETIDFDRASEGLKTGSKRPRLFGAILPLDRAESDQKPQCQREAIHPPPMDGIGERGGRIAPPFNLKKESFTIGRAIKPDRVEITEDCAERRTMSRTQILSAHKPDIIEGWKFAR